MRLFGGSRPIFCEETMPSFDKLLGEGKYLNSLFFKIKSWSIE